MTRLRPLYPGSWRRDKDGPAELGQARSRPPDAEGASMRGDHGQYARVVGDVSIDIVVAVAK
jgi:hypothetical protein